MSETLGIVEVCQWPAPLAEAHSHCDLANRRFGHKPLLEWVVRRVTDCQQLARVIVICNGGRAHDAVQRMPPDIPVFLQEGCDPLQCLAAAVREYAADSIVRIGVDTPFVDPVLIDRLVSSVSPADSCDYASYCLGNGRPAINSQVGVVAEWCRGESIRMADQQATDPLDRREPTRYLCRHPEHFQLRLIPLPAPLDRSDLRLGIHVEEDWEHAQVIFDALGPESLDWQHITGLLDQQPAIRDRMALLNRTVLGDKAVSRT